MKQDMYIVILTEAITYQFMTTKVFGKVILMNRPLAKLKIQDLRIDYAGPEFLGLKRKCDRKC